jgi:hypothetical protein
MGECCSKQTDEPVSFQKPTNLKVIDNLEDIEQIKRTHGPYENVISTNSHLTDYFLFQNF